MATTRHTAVKVLSSAELELFDASLGKDLNSHDAKELEKLVTRARRLRDKQRDLLRRQRLATRKRTGSKGGPVDRTNTRTGEKAELAEEMLARLEQRLAKVESKPKRAPAKPVKKSPPPGKKHREPAVELRGTGAKDLAEGGSTKKKATKKKKKSAKKKASKKKATKKTGKKSSTSQRKTAGKSTKKSATRAKSAGDAPPEDSESAREVAAERVKTGKGGLVPEPSLRSGFVSNKARRATHRQQPDRARQQSVQAHTAARGRRNQAKRDGR